MLCPLCNNFDIEFFHCDKNREYLQCRRCKLVFVPDRYRLSAQDEKTEYDRHCNSVTDPGYRKFLSRLFIPVCERLLEGSSGLEFGCGPGPALAAMFQEAGFTIALFDKYYHNHPEVLKHNYDFITATEVFEHLQHPGTEIQKLWKLLKPGGILGIMTKMTKDKPSFANWHYIRDLTHICFFSQTTFRWLGARLGAEPEFSGSDVIIFQKPLKQ
ncbi:class I SAM-dependent methyltransferase [Lentisphaerota bacterium ZTH]|nr:class I SAM-dependent methyltransferase [Lentisphaerota bacterium]WET05411.1 class I SAM-dependent methyltransferase [Lentisphaerota bacterium ZTH]